jgi:hypothetical protein
VTKKITIFVAVILNGVAAMRYSALEMIVLCLFVVLVPSVYGGVYQLTDVTISHPPPANQTGTGSNEAMFEVSYLANWLGTAIEIQEAETAPGSGRGRLAR